MEAFYIAVLVIAVVILMLILTTLGVAMRKGNADVAWPPGDAAKCPIGWEAGGTPTQCKIPDASLISGEIYSTYSSTGPLELGYKENTGTDPADWTTSTIPIDKVAYVSPNFTVTVTDEIQARAFTQNRPIKIDNANGKITNVPTKSTVKATYTTTGLVTNSSYKVYTTYVDAVKGVNSVGTGTATATSTPLLIFDIKPTATLITPIYAVKTTETAISDAGLSNVKTLTGTYTPESKTVSFTATGITAAGAIYFKKAYFDFNDATYTRCGKKVFAKKFNLIWDGVSEYNKC